MMNRLDGLEVIETRAAPSPGGHYSQAISAGGLIFVSGQLPLNQNGRVPDGSDFEAQVRLALSNLLAILDAGGSAIEDVVKITAYIVGVERWPKFNEVYAQVFSNHRPARTVVPVVSLHYGCLVEIEAVAFSRRGVIRI